MTVHAAAETVAQRVPVLARRVEPVDENRCMLDVGSDTPQMLAVYLGMLDLDFEVSDSPELVDQLLKLAERYRSAVLGQQKGA